MISCTVKVPCCDAAGENTSPRTGRLQSSWSGQRRQTLEIAQVLQKVSLVLKFYLLEQVVQFSLWRGQRIVLRTMSMGKRGKLAARSVAAVWPVNSWSISRACLHLNTQAQTNFSKPHTKVLAPFVLRLIFAQLGMKQDF